MKEKKEQVRLVKTIREMEKLLNQADKVMSKQENFIMTAIHLHHAMEDTLRIWRQYLINTES